MLKKLIFAFSFLFIMVGSTMQLAQAAYDPLQEACSGNGGDSAACTNRSVSESDNPVTDTTQSIVNIVSIVVGAAAIVVIVVSGITMTMSQGDSGKIKSSRDAIIYAAVGLVVTALARTIVIFVISRT